MTDAQTPLIIKDFQKAVADSPHLGHALMRNIDIEAFPGAMKTAKKLNPIVRSIAQATTFTVVAATDVCTAALSLLSTAMANLGLQYSGAAVYFITTGTLPAGLSLNTVYFLIEITTNTFKVAATRADVDSNTPIDITDAGTGVHTINLVPVGTFNRIVKQQVNSYHFAVDSNGRVWYTTGSFPYDLLVNTALDDGHTALANAAGNGLQTFTVSDASKTYLFAFRDALIDYIDVTSVGVPSWHNGWKSLNATAGSARSHFSKIGQDGIIYFCDDRFIGSIVENAGSVFDPTSSGTYTYNNQALDLPLSEIANHFTELSTNLYIAGLTYNKVYPWDRLSDSFTLPLDVPEVGIYKIINSGSQLYIFAGRKGNIYISPGTFVKLFKKVPEYLTNNSQTLTAQPITWGDIAIKNGAILFGLSVQTSGNSGVYILYPDGRILQDNTPSSGSIQVSAIYAEDDFYYIGYAGGIDYTSTSQRQSNTDAVFQSALYPIGDKIHKAMYSRLELQLAKPSSNGQILVKTRGDTSSSFGSAIATFNADGSKTSFSQDIGLTDLESLQIQLEFGLNVEITQLTFYP